MSFWQIIIMGMLVTATWTGRPGYLLTLAMFGNVIATMAFAGNLSAVAVADVLAAAILVFQGRREVMIAILFLVMLPIYLGVHLLSLPNPIAYVAVDALAYMQIAIMGRWDDGLDRLVRHWCRRSHSALPRVPSGRVASRYHRVSSQEDRPMK